MSGEKNVRSRSRRVSAPKSLRASVRVLAEILCWFAVLLPATLILGSFVPFLPYVSTLGSFLVPTVSTWFVLVPLVGALLALVLWRRKRATTWLALLVVAALSFAGGVVVEARMIAATESAGADIDLLATLGFSARATPDDVVAYAEFDGEPQQLSIYEPATTTTDTPVLMYVHGGGWIAGSRDLRPNDMRWFADQGWLVVSVDYPLSTDSRHLWDAQEEHVACAMSWVSANAGAYGADASKLAMAGDSAGGNLVINAAYQANQGTLESACGGTVPMVQAISTTYPVADPASFYNNDNLLLGGIAKTMAGEYIGGSPDKFPERYEAVTSSTFIDASAPPTFIIVGERDHLVPTGGAHEFADLASAAGIDVSLVAVPYADHAFDYLFNSVGNQAFRQLTLQWFVAHGL